MYLTDNDRRAQASYDAMLARGPKEAPTLDVFVDYKIQTRPGFTLKALLQTVGGEARFSSSVDENGLREVVGYTDLEDVESEDAGREIFHGLLHNVPGVDMDDPDIIATGPDPDDFIRLWD